MYTLQKVHKMNASRGRLPVKIFYLRNYGMDFDETGYRKFTAQVVGRS